MNSDRFSRISAAAEAADGTGGAADFAARRGRMVDEQLAARGIADPGVLAAMRSVPRHEFVPQPERARAYADRPLPIGGGQTISQPYIVALMSECLAPGRRGRVLEIGTGSGYQAAVLAELFDRVFTIETDAELAARAARCFERLGLDRIETAVGDGRGGWPEHAPFDAVIATAAPERVPPPLMDQLAEGGRMVIPVGPVGGIQELILLRKENGRPRRESVLSVRFVPMTGQDAPDDPEASG